MPYVRLRIALVRKPRTASALRTVAVLAALALALLGIPALRGPAAAAVGFSTRCDSLIGTMDGEAFIGGSGRIVFSCPDAAAFDLSKSATLRPSFILSPPYTNLSLVPYPSNATDAGIPLEPGQAVTIPGGSWDYSIAYANLTAAPFPAFTVGWLRA